MPAGPGSGVTPIQDSIDRFSFDFHVDNKGGGAVANFDLGKGWQVGGFVEVVKENRDVIWGVKGSWKGGGKRG